MKCCASRLREACHAPALPWGTLRSTLCFRCRGFPAVYGNKPEASHMPKRHCLHKLPPTCVAIAVSWLYCLSAVPAQTDSRDELYTLRLESLPLEQSLQEFARQSGLQVIFFSKVTEGLTGPALAGQYTLSNA